MAQTKAQLIGGLGISTAQSLVVGSAVTINSSGITAGIITASNFVGNVTGNVTGTASTASFATTSFGLSGTPNITVGSVVIGSGVTINNSGINITGVTTTGNLFARGSIYNSVTTTGINKTLVNREYCTVTSSSLTITLPDSPSAGWEVGIAVGNFANTVVARNGSNIMGLAEDMTMDKAYLSFQFIYVDATVGWRFF